MATLKGYNKNNFALWLKEMCLSKLKVFFTIFTVGTCRKGGTFFWYRDINCNYRKLKRIFYKHNSHRYKPSEVIYKGYALLYTNNKGYEYCLYGEFQLSLYREDVPVFLVESEKTVVICHAYYPQYV